MVQGTSSWTSCSLRPKLVSVGRSRCKEFKGNVPAKEQAAGRRPTPCGQRPPQPTAGAPGSALRRCWRTVHHVPVPSVCALACSERMIRGRGIRFCPGGTRAGPGIELLENHLEGPLVRSASAEPEHAVGAPERTHEPRSGGHRTGTGAGGRVRRVGCSWGADMRTGALRVRGAVNSCAIFSAPALPRLLHEDGDGVDGDGRRRGQAAGNCKCCKPGGGRGSSRLDLPWVTVKRVRS